MSPIHAHPPRVRAGRAALALISGLVLLGGGLGAWWLMRPSPPARVQRLRPVLVENGRPAVEEAVAARLVEEVRFRDTLTGWAPYMADVKPVEEALGGGPNPRNLVGFVVQPADTRSEAQRAGGAPPTPPQVRGLGLQWQADQIGTLLLRAEFSKSADARIYFRTLADEARQREELGFDPESGAAPLYYFPNSNSFELAVQASSGQRVWSFETAGNPAWTGTVTALRLDLVQGYHPYVLDSLAGVRREIAFGPSPEVADGAVVDAGLVSLAVDPRTADSAAARYEGRRAYPALCGRAQAAPADVDGASTLRWSVGLPAEAGHLSGPVEFEVLAVAADLPDGAGLGPWAAGLRLEGAVPVDRITLDPARDAGRWHSRAVALPVDGEAALVLRTTGGAPDGQLNGLWGPLWVYPDGRETVPSVVLITADTLRADHVGHYGATSVATPVMDALARRGAAFLDTIAPCNATSPSHASILTGLYPKDHGVLGNQTLLPEEVETLTEIMRRSGRVTLASSSVRHLNARLSGLGQGMDVYFDTPPLIPGKGVDTLSYLAAGVYPPPVSNIREAYRGADDVHRLLFPVLEELGPQPFFLWVHYYDPHTPYRSEREFEEHYGTMPRAQGTPILEALALRRADEHPYLREFRAGEGEPRTYSEEELLWNYLGSHPHLSFLEDTSEAEYVSAMYRAGVAQLDRDVGRLFDHLEGLGRLDDTIVALTADHGEALGERDVWFDHQGVYDNTLRIPFVLAGPGVPAGVDVTDPVEVIDLVPTLCELLDVPAPAVQRGRALGHLLAGEAAGGRRRWFQHSGNLEAGYQDAGEHFILSVIDHPRGSLDRPVAAGERELYDRAADPALLHDLAAERAARADSAAREVEAWLADRALDVEAMHSELDPSDRLALQGLGYTVTEDAEDGD